MKDLLQSRKFWFTLLTLLVLLVGTFLPGFNLDGEKAADFAIVIVAYVVGVAVDPGPGGWAGVFKSRKFWAAVVGVVFIFLDAFHVALPLGLTSEQVTSAIVVVAGYIVAVAVEGKLYL